MRGTVIAIFKTAEDLGYVSNFFSPKWWPYFPDVPYHKPDFLNEFALRHYIAGFLLVLVGCIDYFTFYNYPIQRSIVLARTERSYSENNKLLEIAEKAAHKDDLFR